ncbi:lantibiotic dehydratase family protein [Flavobacterium sp. SM15]|uniref:lantibiotic dehydratase family protein n=1 Tax=Flavobacterium sp. SM15 TaxID=2908005 RepID=UPI001EDA15D4|nr:lantibiotic dehydratase family protein [Flavobacterium sp. SM15]MCG2612221.1 lantibiotic dehydratase family protein [Flavobacterium sp. SM15]
MPRYQIKSFSNYVLRTPAFPLSVYLELLEDYSEMRLREIIQDPYFEEAIHIASPDLVHFLKKYIENPKALTKGKQKSLELTFLKYLARSSSRCTPFGLFAGCAVGNFGTTNSVELTTKDQYIRFSQFDMCFWMLLLEKLTNNQLVRSGLRYFPNTSLYVLGDFYRYVEFTSLKLKREHKISALRKSPTLEKLLDKAQNGATIDELIEHLVENESEINEARAYVNHLIETQLLISELDPRVTGNEVWDAFFAILNRTDLPKEELQVFYELKLRLELLDHNIIPASDNYRELDALIEKIEVAVDRKYLLQTDLSLSTRENKLDASFSVKTLEALRFLNGIRPQNSPTSLRDFVIAFQERYETREMPLAIVLDNETGIGYLQQAKINDAHPLLDRFSFKEKSGPKVLQAWSSYDYLLEEKLKGCQNKNQAILYLSEKDFPDFNSDWEATPASFSVMVELVKNKGVETVVLESSGNTSAAKLLGRFCSGNKAIHDLTQSIVVAEETHKNDVIFAEIVHIPEARTCNVLRRPVLRTFEIPYLCNPGVTSDRVIGLDDLMVSVRNDVVVLRSKKHNKEVHPCLSTAHNYSGTVLPVYHFLCDLQFQYSKPIYNFSWGVLEHHHRFFPRVVYKEVVLAKARWIIDKEELQHFYMLNGVALLEHFSNWRRERQVSRYVNWVPSDNTLLLDLEQLISVELLLKSVGKYSKIVLEEFLFSDDAVVKNSQGQGFTNQFVFSYYKQTA